eukprot:TRINITY_DN4388_c0_g2_i1.p2 TRINITY_DN4388_c0_g2~~TRINITY_DN4388_c0_g2_i1.p2  ORF type:complete len:175 (+),score=17.45 TRINITY_DN4388_c0_g2_i1:213-737(+)
MAKRSMGASAASFLFVMASAFLVGRVCHGAIFCHYDGYPPNYDQSSKTCTLFNETYPCTNYTFGGFPTTAIPFINTPASANYLCSNVATNSCADLAFMDEKLFDSVAGPACTRQQLQDADFIIKLQPPVAAEPTADPPAEKKPFSPLGLSAILVGTIAVFVAVALLVKHKVYKK